jgi:signal transduction histidine kinase
MVVQAGTAVPRARRIDDELAEVLGTVERAGREALVELRRLLGVLRTVDGDGGTDGLEGPVPGIHDLSALVERARDAGLAVDLDATEVDGVAPGVALCAYRVVQEGLTNALRHSSGRRATVTVAPEPAGLRVRVLSVGPPAEEGLSGAGAGVGLVGLRERVLLCGGALRAEPTAEGFALEAVLPLQERSAAPVGPA